MQYNELEKLGERVSRLGFGCMRFPTTPEGGIDEPRAEAMLDRAYRAGVNYFDTAYFYHQHTGEAFVGRMMRKYPRDSFKLATKMPMSIVTSLDQAKEIFEGQLAALGLLRLVFASLCFRLQILQNLLLRRRAKPRQIITFQAHSPVLFSPILVCSSCTAALRSASSARRSGRRFRVPRYTGRGQICTPAT